MTCDVRHIQAGPSAGTGPGGGGSAAEAPDGTQGMWRECAKHSREYEAALAALVASGSMEQDEELVGDIRDYLTLQMPFAGAAASQKELRPA